MSKFDEMFQRVTEALPVTPAPTGTMQPQATVQQPGQVVKPGQPQTPPAPAPNPGIQNPALQALASAKTADDVAKILSDPTHQQALQSFLQKK